MTALTPHGSKIAQWLVANKNLGRKLDFFTKYVFYRYESRYNYKYASQIFLSCFFLNKASRKISSCNHLCLECDPPKTKRLTKCQNSVHVFGQWKCHFYADLQSTKSLKIKSNFKLKLLIYCNTYLHCFKWERSGGLQTKWFSKFFSKKICIIHFDKHQILSRMVVIWNHQSHVVALKSKSYWKFANHFTAHLRTIWRHHGYQNDPLLIVRVLTEPDFRYRKYFRFYSKMHFSTFRHQQNVFFVIKTYLFFDLN